MRSTACYSDRIVVDSMLRHWRHRRCVERIIEVGIKSNVARPVRRKVLRAAPTLTFADGAGRLANVTRTRGLLLLM